MEGGKFGHLKEISKDGKEVEAAEAIRLALINAAQQKWKRIQIEVENKVVTIFTFAPDPHFLENDDRLPKGVTALPGPVFNKSGVLISCGASLYWEEGKVAIFHCSFLSNLTTDVTVVGTKGNLRLHDFIIPLEENKASLYTSYESGFTDLQRRLKPNSGDHVVTNELPQEVEMVKELSWLIGIIKAVGGKPEKKWQTLSRKTQLVRDAVKASIERGFESVEVIS
ncbi:hypothetical protein ACH5RR_034462 [Cinchona calisaya]|uniref:Uncharacterized protein n=1 Tax=Cinchona calisaya TaxID=153742 RepID=A0ABD2YB04_9GENT